MDNISQGYGKKFNYVSAIDHHPLLRQKHEVYSADELSMILRSLVG